MPTPRSLLPYATLAPDDSLVRVTAPVSQKDKRTVLGAFGDDGAITFVIQYAFQRAAEFVRTHDIKAYDTASHAGFVAFLRDGAPARTASTSDAHDVDRRAPSVQRKDADAKSKSVGNAESRPGRSGRVKSVIRPQEE